MYGIASSTHGARGQTLHLQVSHGDEDHQGFPKGGVVCDCLHDRWDQQLSSECVHVNHNAPCMMHMGTLLHHTVQWQPEPCELSDGVMHAYAVAYYVFGSVGYSQLGTDFEYDRPVTSLLPPGLWSNLANAGLLAHCIIAYMVYLL